MIVVPLLRSPETLEPPLSKIFAFFVVACCSLSVHADSGPAFLTKEQASEAIGGKAFTFARPDGAKIRWDFKRDGTVYANNRSSARKDAGDWTFKDDGAVCIKWRVAPMTPAARTS
jgi:hypothetical protein